METKRINIFNNTPRKIKCIEKTFDYLGDGVFFAEERLEVGTIYTLEKIEVQSYGIMIYLLEVDSKYGFQDFLFEELSEHNLDEYMSNYKKWFHSEIKKGVGDVKAGCVETAQESIQAIKEKNICNTDF